MTGFLLRFRQRKLVQWALAYIAAAFALIQVLDVVAQRFGWPDQLEKLLILALVIGFVVMLVLAWYHGERGAQKVSSTEIVIVALLLAIGGGLLWRFARITPGANAVAASNPDAASSPDAAQRNPGVVLPTTPVAAIPAKSIAVLPLSNESGEKDQQYFSDGLSEDLITTLSQFAGLKVINRDSSFRFRNSKDSVQQIGGALGVAHLLEGSVHAFGQRSARQRGTGELRRRQHAVVRALRPAVQGSLRAARRHQQVGRCCFESEAARNWRRGGTKRSSAQRQSRRL